MFNRKNRLTVILLFSALIPFQNCSTGFDAISSTVLHSNAVVSDQIPPTTPQNLAMISKTTNQITVGWNPSSDDIELGGYRLYKGGVMVASVASTSSQYTFSSLSPMTSYSFYITAFDSAGNVSSPSATLNATTSSEISSSAGISAAPVTVTEGGMAAIVIQRTGDGSPALSLAWSIKPGILNPTADFPSLSGTVSFPANSTSALINIPTTDDSVVEGAEQFDLTITEAGNAVPAINVTITIIDNEPVSIADLKPGEWYEVPNSKIQSVIPNPAPPGSPGGITNAWSGAAYDTKRDRLIVTGGGHGDYSGNEIYLFDLNTLQWSRPWGPSDFKDIPPSPDLPIYGQPTLSATRIGSQYKIEGTVVEGPVSADGFRWWRVDFDSGIDGWAVEHYLERLTIVPPPSGVKFAIGDRAYPVSAGREEYLDGSPASRHSYSGLEYLPNIDRLFMTGGSLWGGSGGMGIGSWLFDFLTLKWTRTSDSPHNAIPYAAYDPVTKKVYVHKYAVFYEHDVISDQWVARGSFGPGFSSNTTSVLDPVTRKFMLIGLGTFAWYDMTQAGNWELTFPATTGDTAPVNASFPGVTYDPVSQRVIAWIGGTDVYSLNTATRVWKKLPAAATNTANPGEPTHTGTHGRFRYIPSKNLFIVVNQVNSNVFLYKLAPNP
jgi:hypothetical protein